MTNLDKYVQLANKLNIDNAKVISVDDLVESVYRLENFSDAFEHAKRPNTLKILLKP